MEYVIEAEVRIEFKRLVDRFDYKCGEEYDKNRHLSLSDMKTIAGKCVDEAIRELVVDEDNKWIIIKWSCIGTNEIFYEGNFICRFSTPYDAFYSACLNDLMDRLI